MPELATIVKYLLIAIPILYAITIHEVAHGWVAKINGDNTAASLGRLSLNPIKHVDPIGTVVVPLVLLYFFGAPFGWAKPVPVNWNNLHKPKRDMAFVALAGPLANLMMLIVWALILKLADSLSTDWWHISQIIIYMAKIGILINIVVMVLNMIPIPPLDGSRVVSSLIPDNWANTYAKVEPYGIVIVVVLMISGVLGKLLLPTVFSVSDFVISLLAMF